MCWILLSSHRMLIVPIHKCDSKTNVKNYQPISLLCLLSKVLEKLIHQNAITFFLVSHSLQHNLDLSLADPHYSNYLFTLILWLKLVNIVWQWMLYSWTGKRYLILSPTKIYCGNYGHWEFRVTCGISLLNKQNSMCMHKPIYSDGVSSFIRSTSGEYSRPTFIHCLY